MNNIKAHWRGELSLGRAFLLNWLGVNFLLGILDKVLTSSGIYDQLNERTAPIFLIVILAIVVWQYVGLWRCAKNTGKIRHIVSISFLLGVSAVIFIGQIATVDIAALSALGLFFLSLLSGIVLIKKADAPVFTPKSIEAPSPTQNQIKAKFATKRTRPSNLGDLAIFAVAIASIIAIYIFMIADKAPESSTEQVVAPTHAINANESEANNLRSLAEQEAEKEELKSLNEYYEKWSYDDNRDDNNVQTISDEELEQYLLEANQGSSETQFTLGKMYRDGDGVPKDTKEAFKWLRMAAEQSHAESQVHLAQMYSGHSDGIPRDVPEAFKWLRKSAKQGFAKAQLYLGFAYRGGQDVPQNYVEAVKWYRKAAEQGQVSAQFVLGNMYADGEGVPQDYAEAYLWSSLAVVFAEDETSREINTHRRDNAAKMLSPKELSEAQKRATKLFEEIQQRNE